MNEWKWSKGETYYKSARILEKKQEMEKEEKDLSFINESAIYHSLNGFTQEENFMDQTPFRNEINSKREDLDSKISDRELLFQRGTNPFLPSTNYVNDIAARDNFLKPQNTSTDKITKD